LVKNFGWTKSQIEEQPAVWLDWILSVHGIAMQIENEGV
jgi:hypothetical protein